MVRFALGEAGIVFSLSDVRSASSEVGVVFSETATIIREACLALGDVRFAFDEVGAVFSEAHLVVGKTKVVITLGEFRLASNKAQTVFGEAHNYKTLAFLANIHLRALFCSPFRDGAIFKATARRCRAAVTPPSPQCFCAVRSYSQSYYLAKVGIPEFLNGVGRGVEAHVAKLEAEIGDIQKLLETRTLRLKKLGIPCKHRKLILTYAHKYRLGLWRPRDPKMPAWWLQKDCTFNC
ncbi:uncharacterized protein LOC109840071 [Asparagus officinalis]|uniref:uncharacterized protein LOC109840071 n=1 Tax=Asparagus officinalis TaxID=4686 RepID=UPI00098E6910|nr:uncharacterized protein LOC109840071 [Asparagus officinalis]